MSLQGYAEENGWFLTVQKSFGGLQRRLRDRLLERKMGTTGLGLGRFPRLMGLAHMKIGANFKAADGLWLEAVTEYGGERYAPEISIGANCNVSGYVHIACTNRVVIGEGMLCGSGVIITDHAHGQYRGMGQTGPEVRPTVRRLSNDGAVVIGKNVWLGDGVMVLAGAVIGDGAVIGANSVVNGIVPEGTIAVGSPAKVVRCWDGLEWVK